jgi:hypothetical protein
MLDPFRAYLEDVQSAALKQYCKMENVSPEGLVQAAQPKSAMKLKMKTMAFRVLQSMDKRLNVMMNRLTAEMEHSGMVQGRLS